MTRGRIAVALAVAAVAAVALGVLQIRSAADREPVPPPVAAPSAPPPAAAPEPLRVVYVDPAGDDTGDGSPDAPLRTIQAGLATATPGTEIRLAPGEYREQLATVRAGEPGAPITIKGPETGKDRAGRYRAVVYGTGRVISVNHSHHVLDGFTVDGQEELAGVDLPTELAAVDAFKDRVQGKVKDGRLVYVGADERSRDLTGITLSNMFLSGAGGECVRLRNNAHDNAVVDSVIQYCGMFGKGDGNERAVYHNGEGVYIGTSPNSDDQPMHENDPSARNVVARNIIRPFGSECFNVKENAHDNVFEGNVCVGNTESTEFDGSNVELRGHANVVRDNEISESAGASIKITADEKRLDRGGNVVQNNRLSAAAVALLLDSTAAQGPMCGNVVDTRALVDQDDDEDQVPPGDITAPCAP